MPYADPEQNRIAAYHRVRRWRKKNPDRYQAQRQAYKPVRQPQDERYRRENVEKVKAARKRWSDAHPEKIRLYRVASESRRRAQRRNAPGSFTHQQLEARFAFYGNVCAYCGLEAKLTIDHAIPLCRGGSQWPANLRPACGSCNSRKRHRTALEWAA